MSIGDQFQLIMMNMLYDKYHYTEEQWMEHVEKALVILRRDNPRYTDRDIDRLREKHRQDWRNFIALKG
jgi:transcription elongation factor GreA-like protein